MIAYLGRRLIQSILILLGISIITFALLYLLPADPVRQIAGRSATPATVATSMSASLTIFPNRSASPRVTLDERLHSIPSVTSSSRMTYATP